MQFSKIGIVGCGQMGSGIAEVAAKAGLTVIAREINDELLSKGKGRIEKSLAKAVEKGKLSAEEKSTVMGRIKFTTGIGDLCGCDLVIEAATEDIKTKLGIFIELDKVCKPEAVLASNTSSLSITELAAGTSRPGKFLGMHFFNPVPVMKLVEVVRTVATDEQVIQAAKGFAEQVGKVPVLAKDGGGFIVNRLLVPYLFDAITVYQNGLASREDIDNGMKFGCGHPMGPLELNDFIGLDTMFYIGEILFEEFKEPRFAPPPLLKRMVQAGFLGKKTGRGFYDYRK
ncbi:MAG: 3-hydroxybutyryl-CoA dehydrogenase [candidate division Zixibacteria bacterium CG_4_9_14_3_um_filter_46_8]|nr:MAG: 3-hydroxybutyryl-CoA dehydrogenase [candidate division Zixibacteria bacterium CG_4_9_14_3_um_filter_46_8]